MSLLTFKTSQLVHFYWKIFVTRKSVILLKLSRRFGTPLTAVIYEFTDDRTRGVSYPSQNSLKEYLIAFKPSKVRRVIKIFPHVYFRFNANLFLYCTTEIYMKIELPTRKRGKFQDPRARSVQSAPVCLYTLIIHYVPRHNLIKEPSILQYTDANTITEIPFEKNSLN